MHSAFGRDVDFLRCATSLSFTSRTEAGGGRSRGSGTNRRHWKREQPFSASTARAWRPGRLPRRGSPAATHARSSSKNWPTSRPVTRLRCQDRQRRQKRARLDALGADSHLPSGSLCGWRMPAAPTRPLRSWHGSFTAWTRRPLGDSLCPWTHSLLPGSAVQVCGTARPSAPGVVPHRSRHAKRPLRGHVVERPCR